MTAFAAIGAAAVIGSVALASGHSTVVFLASNNAPNVSRQACQQGCGPKVTAPVKLTTGQDYQIDVTGTVSVWSNWHNPCGKPENKAEFPTAGPTTPTGDDAQFRFAIHIRTPGTCRATPFAESLFQINLGSGWFHPIAVGNPTTPSGNHGSDQHPYTFLVVGQGAEPKFRFVDFHPSDNNGKFKIVVTAAP